MSIDSTASSVLSDQSDDVRLWEPDDKEKDLVRETWSDDFDFLYDLGASIYTYIFETNPRTKALFPGIHRHGAEWKHSKEFREQALKFVQTISYAVKNIYHLHDDLVPLLHAIGGRHVKFMQRGFKPQYWDVSQDAMQKALEAHIASVDDLSQSRQVDAIRVWRRLAAFITAHMKDGYFSYLESHAFATEHCE